MLLEDWSSELGWLEENGHGGLIWDMVAVDLRGTEAQP